MQASNVTVFAKAEPTGSVAKFIYKVIIIMVEFDIRRSETPLHSSIHKHVITDSPLIIIAKPIQHFCITVICNE